MKVIMRLNIWANMCGNFFNAYLEPKDPKDKTFYPGRDPSPNNGYNCRHPEQEEKYEGVGCCFAHSCPMAYPADGLECQRFGVECEDCGNEGCECDEDMMVCEIPNDKFDERYMYREAAQAGGGRKMNGTIKRFDGNQGRIIGDNGADYFFHWTDITGGAKHKAAAKRPVRFAAEETEKGLRARDVEVIRFEAPHGDSGSWSFLNGRFKCSECFSTTEHPFKFCPHCGAKMDKGENNG